MQGGTAGADTRAQDAGVRKNLPFYRERVHNMKTEVPLRTQPPIAI